MNFIEKLNNRWTSTRSMLCVGLDPDLDRLPACINDAHTRPPDRVLAFNRAIIDATADLVCAFKPQIAHYSATRMEDVLEQTIAYIHETHPDIPVILDAKRGDIGSTASHYATEAFERYGADAVTVNPYLGFDSVEPFINYSDRGVIILCRTSNAGSAELQTLPTGDGELTLYEHLATRIAEHWNTNGNCAVVVGATWPNELARVRDIIGDMPILVPGVGAQGGDLETVLTAGATGDGFGLIINSARGILYASQDESFASAARTEAANIQTKCAVHLKSFGMT